MALGGVVGMGKSRTISSPPTDIPFRLSLNLPLSQPLTPTGRFRDVLHVFVAPAPPPAWPPHFHGRVFGAFSILQGEYHVSFSKESAENLKTLLTTGRFGWTA